MDSLFFLLALAFMLGAGICLLIMTIDTNSIRNHAKQQTELLTQIRNSLLHPSSFTPHPSSPPPASSPPREPLHPALQPMRPPGGRS